MTRSYCAFVIICVAGAIGWGQTATKGGIQGVAKDESGKPLAGAMAVAVGIGTTSHASHTVVTNSSGAYSFTGLEPGQYQVCVQMPGGANLDPCKWSKPTLITVTAGQTTANQTSTAVKGSLLEVRINDPLRLLAVGTGSSAGDIIVGVLLPQSLFLPMRMASSDATGRTYDAAIPTNVPVQVQIHSMHLEIADTQGVSLAPASSKGGTGSSMASAAMQTVQIAPGAGSLTVTFSVTGKK